MTFTLKESTARTLRYWFLTFVLIGGFMYYHSSASLGAVLCGGLLSLVVLLYKDRREK